MFKKYITRRSVELSVLCGLICAIMLSCAQFEAVCQDLRHNVLRLHIIANSDSAADQAVKLKVRDRILEEASYLFENETELSVAEDKAQDNLSLFEEVADDVLQAEGFTYGAEAKIGESYFETREYEDFTLPAGNYCSLIIDLGNGKGKNWWCVVFPAVCIPAASDADLSDSTSEQSAQIAENPERYVMRFKVVELYEDIKNYLNKR